MDPQPTIIQMTPAAPHPQMPVQMSRPKPPPPEQPRQAFRQQPPPMKVGLGFVAWSSVFGFYNKGVNIKLNNLNKN